MLNPTLFIFKNHPRKFYLILNIYGLFTTHFGQQYNKQVTLSLCIMFMSNKFNSLFMKKTSLLLGILALSAFVSYSQNKPLFNVSEASAMPFSSMGNAINLNAQQISDLTRGEINLNQANLDDNNFYPGGFYGYPGSSFTNAGVNINLGLQIRKDDSFSKNRLLRVGFQAGSFAYGVASTSNESAARVDTLSSNAGGDPVFVDSIRQRSTDVAKAADLLSFDISLIYQTNQEKQFSLYGGGGINFGISLNSYTQVVTRDNSYYELSGKYEDESFSFSNFNQERTMYDNDVTVMANFFLPIGAKMRLGNHNEFLKRFHVFLEYRPSIFIMHAPEIGTSANFVNQFGAGLSMQF